MNEVTLNALLRLFAIISSIRREEDDLVKISLIKLFLSKQFNYDIANEYINVFKDYYYDIQKKQVQINEKKISLFSDKIIVLISKLNKELHKRQKYLF